MSATKPGNNPKWNPELIRQAVIAERRAQGLPDYIEDPACLQKIARLLAEPSGGGR